MRNILVWKLSVLFCFLILINCSGGGSSAPGAIDGQAAVEKQATVNGRVLDLAGVAVGNARIMVNNEPSEYQTNEQGYFSIRVQAGAGTLTASKDDVILLETCLTAAEGVTYNLGDLFSGMESNCHLPRDCPGDKDCDGLSDEDELNSWKITIIHASGKEEIVGVTSDPEQYDTDGDGLNDGQEYAARTDPRKMDTDGDGLSDYAELHVFKSNPLMLDTDGDACPPAADPCMPDPNLYDGNELFLSGTSPTLADTDGDGLSDYHEINIGGTNPLVADLPELSLTVNGDPLLELDVDYQTGTSAKQQELARQETGKIDTDTVSTEMSVENTIQLHTEAEAGTGTWPPSFNAKLTTDTKFHQGYFHDTSSSWKNASVQESQNNYDEWEKEQVNFDDGKLSIALKITNQSDLSFKVKDLRVVAYRLEGGGNFGLIGTMQPDEAEWPAGGQILGPSGEFTMTVKKEHIGADMMRKLVGNPMAMMFEVGAYSLFQLDEWGVNETVNFSKLGEDVIQRTGLIVIDYGNGNVERHMVATNVYRNPDGSGRGISMKKAMAILGIDYETTPALDPDGKPGKQVLYRVKNVQAWQDADHPMKRGFWLVGGTGPEFDPNTAAAFDGILLRNSNSVNLVYVEDLDGDGLFNREEYLLGTDPENSDSDGDELSDYEETKVGWPIAVSNRTPYQVFSDPRFRDADQDFLSDKTEFYLGTDPYLQDTDGDGLADAHDSDPLNPPCLSAHFLGLAAWWDGTTSVSGAAYRAEDRVLTEPFAVVENDGTMVGAGIPPAANTMLVPDRFGNPNGAFKFNELSTSNNQHIEVPSGDGVSLQRDLTLSTWVYWYGPGSGAAQAALLTKGSSDKPNYALLIDNDGRLMFRLQRSVHEKCWFSWFGHWDDGSCADENYLRTEDVATTAGAIETGKWVHVTVTFGGEIMRIYINGIKAAERSTTSTWTSGLYKYQTTTSYLIRNNDPLLIGVDSGALPQRPYHGALDDTTIGMRMLQPDEVGQLYGLGICEP